jgi:hypothetical protein
MSSIGPIKSVVVSGNLKSTIKYLLCPPTEFRTGVWNISLSSIATSCHTRNVKEICTISCNMVNADKYNKNNEVEVFEQPLAMTLIESDKPKVQNLDKTWFYMNTFANELIVNVRNVVSEEKLNIDCDIYAIFLFQRVK